MYKYKIITIMSTGIQVRGLRGCSPRISQSFSWPIAKFFMQRTAMKNKWYFFRPPRRSARNLGIFSLWWGEWNKALNETLLFTIIKNSFSSLTACSLVRLNRPKQFFRALSKHFSCKGGSAPLRKFGPYAYERQ